MVYKRIIVTLIFLFVFPLVVYGKEKPQAVFINQIRGEECCSEGSLENLQLQIEKFKEKNIPSFFAIRYDVLINDKYVDYFKDELKDNKKIINIGLLIEITPQLALDSGVKYNGTVERWFEAQNVYTIGYEKDDRKKIIDKLFKTFKDKFGFFPKITSAWMIDTDSLNYIHEKYKVVAHQITREQWGVDSYTLYGGPPHYPYPASVNWAFIPDFNQKNPLLILRQTVTDPLLNYGETKKHYTSQPNDYLNSGLDFEYFKKLIDQALFNQKTTGFILLGLENANDLIYQKEYLKQIDYISGLEDRVVFPNPKQLTDYWSKQQITYYQGKDLINGSNNQAEFKTTPEFRERTRISNGKTYITDYRYYNSDLIDPYNDYIAKKQGFWIVPYQLDSSRINNPESIFTDVKNDLHINKQPYFKVMQFNADKFNKSRFDKYPDYIPEAIEREIDRKKSQINISVGNLINIEFFAKDIYGYPVSISSPIEVITEPKVREVIYLPDGAKHEFIIKHNKSNFQKISLLSNKKIIKTVYLFPKLLPFIKLAW